MGTKNVIRKAQRKKAKRSCQPVKAQRKECNLIFLISEAQRNFRHKLFDSVEAQRNSAIADRHFLTKLKHNLTSAIEISHHNPNTEFLWVLDRKSVNNLLKFIKKAKIYQYYDRNGIKLSLRYRIALSTKKKLKV